MLSREIVITDDGSHSLFVSELNEHYHSTHGALQESEHVFMRNCLDFADSKELSIFEVGFGTGLNALLTMLRAEQKGLKVHYHAIELYPLKPEEFHALNYSGLVSPAYETLFEDLHVSKWDEEVSITPYFSLLKHHEDLLKWNPTSMYDLVFFDAFAPEKQPDLWSEDVFINFFKSMKPGGILSTYCCKGIVKRAMKTAGFRVTKKPGPPGKREIVVAFKD